MLTLAMPQSEPLWERKRSAWSTSRVKMADDNPCGTPLLVAIASSRSATSMTYRMGAHQRGLDEVARAVEHASAVEHLAAFGRHALEGLLHRADRVGVDQRPHEGRRIEGIADAHRGVDLLEPRHHLARHALLHDEPARGGAALARRAHGGESHGAHGEIEIGVIHDDHGVVAAQLEDGAPEA